jgi:hypothetical protein
MKFHENPPDGSRVVAGGGSERLDDANTLFHNFANVPKNTRNMSVGVMLSPSKVCLTYNLKIHSDDRIKDHKTRKACCIHGRAEKFYSVSITN